MRITLVNLLLCQKVKTRETLGDKIDVVNTFQFGLCVYILILIQHTDRISAQYSAIYHLKETLQVGHVIVQMDFAENFQCQIQEPWGFMQSLLRGRESNGSINILLLSSMCYRQCDVRWMDLNMILF